MRRSDAIDGVQLRPARCWKSFLERLVEAAPLLADDLLSPLHEELKVLENLTDEAL